jgi:8-oxo-dGTP pyrophosphatase MutT (NUDIX family)
VEKGELQKKTRRSPGTIKRRILSAGIIPIFQSQEGPRFLLLRAYSYWDFPKGGALDNEDPVSTAVREFREETAIENVTFPWGEEFRETPPYSQGKVARYYMGLVATQSVALLPNPVNGLVEHHEYRWVSYDQATRLVADRVRPILDWAQNVLIQNSRT